MKQLFVFLVFFLATQVGYSQCGTGIGEEQHTGGGVGGSYILESNNDFSQASIQIYNPASMDPDVLANQIREFLNRDCENPETNPDYTVENRNGTIWIFDVDNQEWYSASTAMASAALTYYDPHRSTLINLNAYTDNDHNIQNIPCPEQYVYSPYPGYVPFDPYVDPNNPFNNGGGGGNGSPVNPPPIAAGPCPTDENVQVSGTLLAQLYPSINRGRAEIVAGYINKWKNRAGVTTRKDLAYFIGQILVESGGLNALEEKHNYTYNNIVANYSRFFPDPSQISNYVNCACLFDRIYSNQYENGPESSHDGSKYSGKGIIQLTWKENYRRFNNWYHRNVGTLVDVVQNPELLRDDLEMATISALWFFGIDKRKSVKLYKNIGMLIANDNIDGVSQIVNGGMKQSELRKTLTNATLSKFCL